MNRRIATVSLVLAATLALTACANTIRGAGRDVGNSARATGAAVNDVTSQ